MHEFDRLNSLVKLLLMESNQTNTDDLNNVVWEKEKNTLVEINEKLNY